MRKERDRQKETAKGRDREKDKEKNEREFVITFVYVNLFFLVNETCMELNNITKKDIMNGKLLARVYIIFNIFKETRRGTR